VSTRGIAQVAERRDIGALAASSRARSWILSVVEVIAISEPCCASKRAVAKTDPLFTARARDERDFPRKFIDSISQFLDWTDCIEVGEVRARVLTVTYQKR